MDLKSTYNRIADDWMKDHADDSWWVSETDRFCSLLPPGANVLDVGCGGGVKTKYLLEQGLSVTGMDFSERMIELAEAAVPEARFYVHDLLEPFPPEQTYDGIFAQATLLHIPKKQIPLALQNLCAILNSGGLFYAAVKGIRSGQPEEETVKENDYGYEYERFFSYFTPSELKRYFVEAGLEVIEQPVASAPETKWIQIIGKKS